MAPHAVLASPAHEASPAKRGNLLTRLRHRLQLRGLREDTQAVFSLGPIMGIVGAVIGAFLVFIVIAALLPTGFSGVATVNEAFTNSSTTTGNAQADKLLPVWPIVIGIGFILAIVGLIFAAIKFKK